MQRVLSWKGNAIDRIWIVSGSVLQGMCLLRVRFLIASLDAHDPLSRRHLQTRGGGGSVCASRAWHASSGSDLPR
jgi:hypothetical protein